MGQEAFQFWRVTWRFTDAFARKGDYIELELYEEDDDTGQPDDRSEWSKAPQRGEGLDRVNEREQYGKQYVAPQRGEGLDRSRPSQGETAGSGDYIELELYEEDDDTAPQHGEGLGHNFPLRGEGLGRNVYFELELYEEDVVEVTASGVSQTGFECSSRTGPTMLVRQGRRAPPRLARGGLPAARAAGAAAMAAAAAAAPPGGEAEESGGSRGAQERRSADFEAYYAAAFAASCHLSERWAEALERLRSPAPLAVRPLRCWAGSEACRERLAAELDAALAGVAAEAAAVGAAAPGREWQPCWQAWELRRDPSRNLASWRAVSQLLYRAEAAGEVAVQELSSMLPVALLDPRPGDAVCDLCAAPGSKSLQILEAIGDGSADGHGGGSGFLLGSAPSLECSALCGRRHGSRAGAAGGTEVRAGRALQNVRQSGVGSRRTGSLASPGRVHGDRFLIHRLADRRGPSHPLSHPLM
ncbi:unnamed protein product [Prorocentrum cordatum]|uniref:SAM-dependent MTase RsmB/NOP-type domain-containing protein n=1 Tax=Prorocentrum cordatum TaxID=2364126 RepID=A0ABN9WH11_9DINO|nr:unnamed protein product [Polarella glacialis]